MSLNTATNPMYLKSYAKSQNVAKQSKHSQNVANTNLQEQQILEYYNLKTSNF